MKKTSIALMLAALVLAGPVASFAQTAAVKPAAAPAKKAAPASAAVHATKGVVKSIEGSTLVITKVAGKGPETTFVVNPSTKREGTLAIGASVDVRYRTDGKDKIATAIRAEAPKMSAAAKEPASPSNKKK